MAKVNLKNAGRTNCAPGITLMLPMLMVLLALPIMALHRCNVDIRWVGIYVLVSNALTYWTYALDKRRAEEGLWRVPEARLHLLEMLGGWPGAFLAQRRLRHKCSKVSYQVVFWLIVLVWQFAAFDSLQNWRSAQAAIDYIERTSDHRR